MNGINARAGQEVQIGGVYVPPGFRGQGRAGRAVAAQLAAARDGGARTAILFAGSAPAARAYERIGFERIGTYRVALLHRAAIVGGQP
jgi:predicted GNAT family acetyltransferase